MNKNYNINVHVITTIVSTFLLTILSATSIQASAQEQSKPNILWLITEDNSKDYLKLYNENGASMPAIEKLAQNGLVFNNAFANTPVCSTARTTLATGLYGTSIGTMNHRSYRKVNLPKNVKPFSQILKNAGYFTSNNVKTDYNFIDDKSFWSESSKSAHWRNRKNNQPFFHMQTFAVTHEGKLHFRKGAIKSAPTKHDPKKVELAPIYPDTPTFRYTHARTLDNHVKADQQMAAVIKQLEDDGELENTFIFYFGDHGGVLPGSKGYVFERGLSVPLVVRVPENFKHLLGEGLTKENTRVNGLVSFIDFAPTVLELAGLPSPQAYPGQSFLSKNLDLNKLNQRDEIYAQADRFDEKSDLVRTVRKGNFKYIRNYQPYYPDGLENFYRYKQVAFKEWRELFHQGKLNDQQASFFQPKAPEALYDLANDPWETNNLADEAQYQSSLMQLRVLLKDHLQAIPDLGFIAESVMVQTKIKENFYDYGQNHSDRIQQMIAIADLQLKPFNEVKAQLKYALTLNDDDMVYRAIIALTSFGAEAKSFEPIMKHLLNSSKNIPVRSRALEFLTLVNNYDPRKDFIKIYLQSKHDIERVEMLNIATLLKEQKGFSFIQPESALIPLSKDVQQSNKVIVWLKNRWNYISQ